MTIKIRRDDDSWTVAIGPEMEIGGFETEQSAGRWLIEWLASCSSAANETAAKSRILVAAMMEPRRPQ